MDTPKFYCKKFIKEQSYLPEYRTTICTEQCDNCINEIIEHHSKKKPVNSPAIDQMVRESVHAWEQAAKNQNF